MSYRKEMGFVTVGGQAIVGHPLDDVFKITLNVREIRLTELCPKLLKELLEVNWEDSKQV